MADTDNHTDFDVVADELLDDPLTYQRRFQQHDPVHHSRRGVWFLTRHANVLDVLRAPQSSTDRRDDYRTKLQASPYLSHVENNMFYRSGDEHTHIRTPLGRAFTPRAMNTLRDRLRARAEALVAELDPDGFDLVADFAKPLPVAVICELLGVPLSEQGNLRRWSVQLVAALEPRAGADIFKEADDAVTEMKTLLAELLAHRRRQPSDDLLSNVGNAGTTISDEELLHNAIFLLAAGHDTTTSLITGGVSILINTPAAMPELAANPELHAAAVEEMARLVSPAQMIGRALTAPLTIDGIEIPAGSNVLLGLAAANRDPAVFERPDEVDFARPNPRAHLAFSFGAHACLGAPLAREQTRLALAALLHRFDTLEPTAAPRRLRSAIVAGYLSAPMRATLRQQH